MSFFAKGDFNIKNSWDQNKKALSVEKNRPSSGKSASKNASLVNAGKNIVEPPMPELDPALARRIMREFEAEIPPPTPQTGQSSKKLPPPPQSNKRSPSPNQPQQDDLVASMAGRLKQVETTCNSLRMELKEKNTLCDKLKHQNTFLKGLREDSTKSYDQLTQLEKQNAQLKEKCSQMEAYLKKYGLKWVGHVIQGSLQHEKLKEQLRKPKFNYRMPQQIDFRTIQRRCEELNENLMAEGRNQEIVRENGVHRFREAQHLPIGFYANGIAIKGYKFLPYKAKQSLQVLSDLLDGYFPYILKQKYPQGVLLKAIDKIAIKYEDEIQQASNQSIASLNSNARQLHPPSKQQFLAKLPKQVIGPSGKIIPIRGEIQKKLNGQIQTPKPSLKSVAEQGIEEDPETGQVTCLTPTYKDVTAGRIEETDVCIVKVRTDTGRVCLIYLPKDAKMSSLYREVSKLVKESYKLMSNYPRKSYERDETQTLQELGLYPNGMLHVAK